MTLTFQKEVSDRLNARHDDSEKCRLSIIGQGYCEIEECFTIVGGSFVPPPLVDVGVVKLVPRVKPLFRQKFELVEKVLRCMFNTKKKTAKNNIKNLFPQPLWHLCDDVLAAADIDPTIETLFLRPNQFSRICDGYALKCDETPGLYEYDYRGQAKARAWPQESDERRDSEE